MYGGFIGQPMDFRGYAAGHFAGGPTYPNPAFPYGSPFGPSAYLSSGAGYMPFRGTPNFSSSLRYADQSSRMRELQEYMLSRDPRAGLASRALGISNGALFGAMSGLINRPGINHLFGGDIRDIASAAMLAASGGIYTKHGLTYGGGMFQQAYATQIAESIRNRMDPAGQINGLGVGRVAETVAALSQVEGNAFSGRYMPVDPVTKKIGLSSADQQQLGSVIESSTKLVRQLGELFGEDQSVATLLATAKQITGKVVRTAADAELIRRQLNRVRSLASASGMDELDVITRIAQGNSFAYNVAAPVRTAMSGATATFGLMVGKQTGGSPEAFLNVMDQASGQLMNSRVGQRQLITYGMASKLWATNPDAARRLEEIANNMTSRNMMASQSEIEQLTGRNLSAIESVPELYQSMLQAGVESERGSGFLTGKSMDIAMKAQDRLRNRIASTFSGDSEQARLIAEGLYIGGAQGLTAAAASLAEGLTPAQILQEEMSPTLTPEQVARQNAFLAVTKELTGEERLQLVNGAAAFSAANKNDLSAILAASTDLTTAYPELASLNTVRTSEKLGRSAQLYSGMDNFFTGKNGSLLAMDVLEGLAGYAGIGEAGALKQALGANAFYTGAGGDLTVWDSETLKEAWDSITSTYAKTVGPEGRKYREALKAIESASSDPVARIMAAQNSGLVDVIRYTNAEGFEESVISKGGTFDQAEILKDNLYVAKEDAFSQTKKQLFRRNKHKELAKKFYANYDKLGSASLADELLTIGYSGDNRSKMATLLDFDSTSPKKLKEFEKLMRNNPALSGQAESFLELNMQRVKENPELTEMLSVVRDINRENTAGAGEVSRDDGKKSYIGIVEFKDAQGNKYTLQPVS